MESNSVQGRKNDDLVKAADKGGPDEIFTSTRKGYDPLHRAFHRVNFTGYDFALDNDPKLLMTKEPPSGEGYPSGCRSPDDFTTSALMNALFDGLFEGLKNAANLAVPGSKQAIDLLNAQIKQQTGRDFEDELKKLLANAVEGAFFRTYMVHVPSWVPVNRKGYGPDFDSTNAHNVVTEQGADGNDKKKESEVEVEGVLSRSYLSRHHRPYTQWSRFYHWSFQVTPAPGFKHLVGLGDLLPEREDNDLFKDVSKGNREAGNALYNGPRADKRTPVSTLECMLDLGALSNPPGDQPGGFNPSQPPSILFDKRWPFWPQSGDYFWASGRFVYDCTHASNEKKTGDKHGLHPTAINPIKAFAVTRYEAFKFDELDSFIPVTRFMFFATRKGGYQDFDDKSDIKITDTDYEFIVDLPPVDPDFGEFAIGRTPQFNLNTIVARPRLLKNIAFAPYGTGFDSNLRFHNQEPIIQLVRPTDGKPIRQMRVKIPMSKMPSNRDAWGFVLTMGWADDSQAAKVKRVVVKMPDLIFKRSSDQLRYNVCINGRWIYFPTTNPVGSDSKHFRNISDGSQNHPGPDGLVLHIPDDGAVVITAQGMRRDDQGKYMETHKTTDADLTKDRRLRVGGVIQIDDATAKFIRDEIEKGLGRQIPDGVFKDLDKVKEILKDENIRKILGAAAADLLGQRRIVDWRKDVDTIETDPALAHANASAIAREMKVLPVLNAANQPMGMVEVDLPNGIVKKPRTEMKVLVDLQKTKQPPKVIEFQTMKTVQPHETGFMFIEIQNAPNNEDYTLRCTLEATDPVVPA